MGPGEHHASQDSYSEGLGVLFVDGGYEVGSGGTAPTAELGEGHGYLVVHGAPLDNVGQA